MCGIAGYVLHTQGQGALPEPLCTTALDTLKLRGPDVGGQARYPGAWLGQRRLSIIDTSAASNQPMYDPTGRWCLVFNGEIFNFLELKKQLEQAGVQFVTTGDTEVLLHLLIRHGAAGLSQLNGFFAIALYDTQTHTLLLARDRYGVKPLYLWQQPGAHIAFASEPKALLALGAPRLADPTALHLYFQLNYLPPNTSAWQALKPLAPGTALLVRPGLATETIQWYQLPQQETKPYNLGWEELMRRLETLLDNATQRRLISDVPLGVFLSGGIDSSVVTALAARHKQPLHTFSISFEDKLYDERQYAEAVARKFGTEHTRFVVSNQDLYGVLDNVLAYLDEPFADASALNFYILSRHTRKHVTVALSGDGADEVFGGYMKHQAEARSRGGGLLNGLLRLGSPLLQGLPASRSNTLGRKLWQAQKYAAALGQSPESRYWNWACVQTEAQAAQLLRLPADAARMAEARTHWAAPVARRGNMTGVLEADMALVLAGDMLVKADRMSMACSLEVRTPFLDFEVVDFAFGLPDVYKVTGSARKILVQETFRSILPPELYNRPKQGFEVPLTGWFRTEMRPWLEKELLNRDKVEAQGIFHYTALQQLANTVLHGKPGKEDWTLWAAVVLQQWWDRWQPELPR